MFQKNKSKLINFIEINFIFFGIIFPFFFILPITKELLKIDPSIDGIPEAIVFYTHIIVGLSIYFILLLLVRFLSFKRILGMSLIYLFFVDMAIYFHKSKGLMIGIILVRVIQLYILSLLFNSDLYKKSSKLIKIVIGMVILLILVATWVCLKFIVGF